MPHIRPGPRRIAVLMTLLASCASARAAEPSFRGLGFLPGHTVSQPTAISADGRTVVGYVAIGSQTITNSFQWTAEQGMVRLSLPPNLPGLAQGISADGSVVVGSAILDSGDQVAFRWTAAGTQLLPSLPSEFPRSAAWAVSADGSVVVGSGSEDLTPVAVRWVGDQAQSLGALLPDPTQDTEAVARAVSADGSVVVGFTHSPNGRYEAFRWTQAGGMVGLGDLPGGPFESLAVGVSADGSTVLGSSERNGNNQAFRWTAGTGMVELIGMEFAKTASADGSVIGGLWHNGADELIAMIWTEATGARRLSDILTEAGVDTTGWQLRSIDSITPDGLTLAGTAWNPDGLFEGYIATLPEPSTATLALAIAGTASMRRRRRSGRPTAQD